MKSAHELWLEFKAKFFVHAKISLIEENLFRAIFINGMASAIVAIVETPEEKRFEYMETLATETLAIAEAQGQQRHEN